MSRFEHRIEEGFDRFADHATPSPTAWEAFRTRIAEEADQPEVEIIMLSDDTNPTGNRRRNWVLAAAAALIVLLGAGLIIAATRSDEKTPAVQPAPTTPRVTDQTSPATDPTTTATTTTTTTTVPPEAWSMDAVPPGTFSTTVMDPGFTVTVQAGWAPFQPESQNQWTIGIGIPEHTLLTVNGVKAETPADVIAFATSNGLELSDPEDVEVGGISAQRYQVTGGAGSLFETEFAEFGFDTAEHSGRLTLLELGGRVVAIAEVSSLEMVDATRPESEAIIASIVWLTE